MFSTCPCARGCTLLHTSYEVDYIVEGEELVLLYLGLAHPFIDLLGLGIDDCLECVDAVLFRPGHLLGKGHGGMCNMV